MSAVPGPSNGHSHRLVDDNDKPVCLQDRLIQQEDTVLLRLPSDEIRSVKLQSDNTIHLGKYGSFRANALFGQPCGLTYEIINKGLSIVPSRPIEDVEDTNATNELINDGESVQPLTTVEIEALKQNGVRVDEIIKAQIKQHANYALKTEYSKDKYRMRKEAKFSKTFTTLEPTLFHVSEYWFSKDPGRIRDIRPDALAQMLSLANIQPGGRYLVVDDAAGMIVAGVLERLGGNGRLLSLIDTESPPVYHILSHMNYPASYTQDVLRSLNWATADKGWEPIILPEIDTVDIKTDKQRHRLAKRKRMQDKLAETREELFRGEWDALIISSEYEPYSIVNSLEKYLAGSANLVVHSPHIQILSALHAKLRSQPQYLAPNIIEAWTRRYQVLPGRTHPLMTTSGSGGLILHAIKIYDDPSATAADPTRKVVRAARRRRLETSVGATPAPGTGTCDDAIDSEAAIETDC